MGDGRGDEEGTGSLLPEFLTQRKKKSKNSEYLLLCLNSSTAHLKQSVP